MVIQYVKRWNEICKKVLRNLFLFYMCKFSLENINNLRIYLIVQANGWVFVCLVVLISTQCTPIVLCVFRIGVLNFVLLTFLQFHTFSSW